MEYRMRTQVHRRVSMRFVFLLPRVVKENRFLVATARLAKSTLAMVRFGQAQRNRLKKHTRRHC